MVFVAISDKGLRSQTKGFLIGTDIWSKYKIDVDSGSYSDGKIEIKGSAGDYKKGDSLTVNVYTKKWFLGGRGKWLFGQKIPYDYETKISVLTTGNFSKAPGDQVQFGVRTYFDNKMFTDKWAPVKKNLKDFAFKFDGVHISKSKDNLEIDKDPAKISNDKVKLIASLVKNAALTDTLNVLLDYVASYQCIVPSNGAGHDLNVTAAIHHDSIINAQLLTIQVSDAATHKTYNYWVNTNGGSIAILSKGADGSDGLNVMDGLSGSPGSPGAVSVNTETTTNADGTISTTTNTVIGAGGDGGNGQDGGNGKDGGAGGNGGNIVVNYSPAVAPFLSMIKVTSTAGRGGSGGMGGSAGIGNPNGNAGSNGLDGRSGSDGPNGRKGTVTFTMASSVN